MCAHAAAVGRPASTRTPGTTGVTTTASSSVAVAVLDRVDRGAEVRLDRQTEPRRDRRRDVVGVDEHSRERGREMHCDLGAAGTRRTADDDDAPVSIGAGRSASSGTTNASPAGPQRDESRRRTACGPRSDFDDVVDDRRDEMRPRRRLLAVEHAEHRATARVHVGDERVRERGPTVAGDEDVVLLLERDLGLDDDLTHTARRRGRSGAGAAPRPTGRA